MKSLSEMQKLCDSATDGPWYQSGLPWFKSGSSVLAGSPDPHVAPEICDCENGLYSREEQEMDKPIKLKTADADAAFISAARSFVPWAIARILELEKQLELKP